MCTASDRGPLVRIYSARDGESRNRQFFSIAQLIVGDRDSKVSMLVSTQSGICWMFTSPWLTSR